MTRLESADVLVVGAGPAGLAVARDLARSGAGSVVVLEREGEPGGIPRHSDHTGYGLRDLRRSLRGPEYARRLVDAALGAGAQIRTTAVATGWAAPDTLEVTSPRGRVRLQARAIVLATGARERSRSARLIAGDRPPGVLTTGQLQQLVHLHGRRLQGRAVIVGGELVSWSAVLTLRQAGASVALMTTEHEAIESYAAFHLAGRAALRVPVATRTRVLRIVGRDRVEAVEVADSRTGATRLLTCEWVVVTGDWAAESELARSGGLDIAAGGVPRVDQALASSAAGVFAIGNLAHPVDTADVCALDGAHAAESIARWLRGDAPQAPAVPLLPDATLAWVSPGAVRPQAGPAARGQLLAWPREPRRLATVRIEQAGSVVAVKRLPWPASPGRVLRIPFDLVHRLDPAGGPATVSLA